MARCYFCETSRIESAKYKIVGSDLGKRKQKTINICTTCRAMIDNRQIRKFLDWDNINSIVLRG